MWNIYPEVSPLQYEALSMKVSKNMLAYNKFNRTMYIASLWTISDEQVWRISHSGDEIQVTHWQEITNPEA